jgi:hypothetical protein
LLTKLIKKNVYTGKIFIKFDIGSLLKVIDKIKKVDSWTKILKKFRKIAMDMDALEKASNNPQTINRET